MRPDIAKELSDLGGFELKKQIVSGHKAMIALELKVEEKQGSCMVGNRKALRTEDMKMTNKKALRTKALKTSVTRSLTEGHTNTKIKGSWTQGDLMTKPKAQEDMKTQTTTDLHM
ncbi:hypothetical protein O6H91_06G048600 [Diphasiastrum complanatum]|uniref:Uncharacterized protein n=1 Tax=Diphasiastrum complanatum TaxID=34168 RepID=A0ACC2DDG8_DIPCM|nr:hypothetical protein O6H91_06G048600 [Diphasiastrum complanatum]